MFPPQPPADAPRAPDTDTYRATVRGFTPAAQLTKAWAQAQFGDRLPAVQRELRQANDRKTA